MKWIIVSLILRAYNIMPTIALCLFVIIDKTVHTTRLSAKCAVVSCVQLPSVWWTEGRIDPGVSGGHSSPPVVSLLSHEEAGEETHLPELDQGWTAPWTVLAEPTQSSGHTSHWPDAQSMIWCFMSLCYAQCEWNGNLVGNFNWFWRRKWSFQGWGSVCFIVCC